MIPKHADYKKGETAMIEGVKVILELCLFVGALSGILTYIGMKIVERWYEMNVLISISDEIYRHAKDGSEDSNDEWNAMRAIANGTPIPDNATNGDIVQMMFPYYSYERNDYVQSTEDYIVDSMECMEHDLYFAYDWWNSPYQKGEQ